MIKTRLIKAVPESKKYIAASVVCQLAGLAAGTAAVMMGRVPVGRIVLACVWVFHIIYFSFGVKNCE